MKKYRSVSKKILVIVIIFSFICAVVNLASINPNHFYVAAQTTDQPIGYAAGTTGGDGGTIVAVTNETDLKKYCKANGKYIIQVQGTINTTSKTNVTSDKTIVGIGSDTKIVGFGFSVKNATNVIIKNLTINYVTKGSDNDGITIDGSKYVWVDHCTIDSQMVIDAAHDKAEYYDYVDGACDIKNASEYITVSWCVFKNNWKNMLISSSDSETGDKVIKVTIHHNLFDNVASRNPSIRFGTAHIFNNYYRNIYEYGIASRMGANVLIENNCFDNVPLPITTLYSSPKPGYVNLKGNIFVNCGSNNITTQPSTYVPPYSYNLDSATNVPQIVLNGAGAGKISTTTTSTLTPIVTLTPIPTPAPTSTTPPTSTSTSTISQTLFKDDFEDGNRNGWSTSNGSWSVVMDESKVLKQSSTGSEARTYTGSSDWSDYSVEAKVRVLGTKDSSSGAGVIVRYKSSGNFYALVLRGSKVEIMKKVNSNSSTLASKSFMLSQNTWYIVKLEVSGNKLVGYVNGSQILSVSDSSLLTGKSGLIADRCIAEFDDVSVSSSSEDTTPTSTLPVTATPTATPTPTPTPTPPSTVTPTPTPTPTTAPTPTPTPVPGASAIYVAPNGSADNPGTVERPTILEKAITIVQPGQIIYMRGGTYKYSVQVTIDRNNSGTSSARKCIYAFPNERPVLDFSSQPYGSVDTNLRGLQLNGSYWHIKGLEVMGAADNGIFVGGNYNIIEQCEIHHNRDSGLQISRYISSATKDEWPSYNLILNCTSHDNMDPDNGEDADGFACKLTAGVGNVFRGCVAYYNVDDGWDLYTKSETGAIGEVLIEDCVAYGQGQTSNGSATSSSDGNGFKLGGSDIKVNHTVRRCIAFNNNKHGFTYNSNPGSITVENCTGYNNGVKVSGRNFYFEEGTHVLKNCLSYKESASSDLVSGTVINCVLWTNKQAIKPNGQPVTDNDFYSLTPTITRNSDGSLNFGDFLKPKPGSGLEGIGAR